MQDVEIIKEKIEDLSEKSTSPQQTNDVSDDISQFSEESPNVTPETFKKIQEELVEKAQALEATEDRMKRIAADFDNARKRWERERNEIRQYSIQEFAKDLLPVIDAFEKALSLLDPSSEHSNAPETSLESMVEGMQLVSKVFYDALHKHGIERLPGKGSAFNPEYHNAIAKMVDPSLDSEIVIDEYTAGFRIADRILRTAMVRVGSPD